MDRNGMYSKEELDNIDIIPTPSMRGRGEYFYSEEYLERLGKAFDKMTILKDKLTNILRMSSPGFTYDEHYLEEFPAEPIARSLLDLIETGDEHLINHYIDSM